MTITTLPTPDQPPTDATTNTTTDTAGRQWSRWVSPTGPYLLVIAVVMYALGAAATFIDVVLAKSVFNIIVNANETISWSIAAGISVLAILLTTSAGIELRNGGRAHHIVAGLLIGAWLALGLTLAYLRLSEGSIRGGDNKPKDAAIAAMMLAMYAAAGLDIAIWSHTLWNPRHAALISSKLDLASKDRQLRRHTAGRDRIQHTLTTWPNRQNRLDSSYLSANGIIDQHEAELKAIARDLLTLGTADPAVSSTIYRTPHQPTPNAQPNTHPGNGPDQPAQHHHLTHPAPATTAQPTQQRTLTP